MNKHIKTAVTIAAFSILSATTTLSQAWAVDAAAFKDRFENNFKNSGWSFTSDKAEADGNDIVFHGAKIALDLEGTVSKPEDLGDLRFKNVTEDKDGNYKIEEIKVPSIVSIDKTETNSLEFKNVTFTNVNIPSENTSNTLVKVIPYESVTIESVAASAKGKSDAFLKLDNAYITYKTQSGDKVLDTNIGLKSLSYEPKNAQDDSQLNALKAYGYESLNGSVEFHSSWNMKDGQYDLDKGEIELKDAGKLNITFNLTGITEDVVSQFTTLRNKMLNNQTSENAAGAALLGLAAKTNFVDMKIRYDDNSATGKILDAMATKNNVKRDDLVKQFEAVIPVMAAQLKSPSFAKNVSTELNKFLENPKSLTISASPSKPVSFATLAASASMSPEQLINAINLKVEANN